MRTAHYMAIPTSWILLACSLLGSACADGPDAAPAHVDAVVVEDSAGVEIISVDRDRLAVAWELSPVPEWTIGSTAASNGALDLYGVSDVTVVDDSLVAVAEYFSARLLLVKPNGPVIGRFGGRGHGPSEFQHLQRVFGGRGVIGTWDIDRRRYAEFDLEGRLLFERQAPLPDREGMKVVSGRANGGLDRDSLWWWTWQTVTAPPGETVRPPGALLRLLDLQDTLAVGYGLALRGGGPRGGGTVVLGPNSSMTDGEGGVWIGDNATQRVEFFGNGGRLARVITWTTATNRALSGELKDVLVKEGVIHPSRLPYYPLADSVPAFYGLLAGGGRVWVKGVPAPIADLARYYRDYPMGRAEWMVCEFSSKHCGLVRTPDRFRPYVVGKDFVIALIRDEFDTEQIARFTLREVQRDAPSYSK